MAFSTQREVSDGTLVDVRLQIEFIDREDINVFVDDIPKYVGVDWDWVSDTLFQMREPVPAGQELLVQRATNLAGVLNVFVGGASFDDPTMDENFRQMLFIAQEAREGATLEEVFNDLNMHGYKITNMGAGTEPGDAINYQQYVDDALGAGNARNGAVAARNQAETFRDQAEAAATGAGTARTQAEAAAATSTAQAGLSTTARVASEAARDAAVVQRNQAEGFRNAAQGFATAAGSSAALAEQYAGEVAGALLPIGAIISLIRTTAPAGFGACNGQILSRATFPVLWQLIADGTFPSVSDALWNSDFGNRGMFSTGDGSTTFRMPDYNGVQSGSVAVVLRGNGNRSAGTVGLIQADALQNIVGNFNGMRGDNTGGNQSTGSGAFAPGALGGPVVGSSGAVTGEYMTFDASRVARTAEETRSTNATTLICMKMFGAAVDEGTVNVLQLASDVVSLTSRVQALEARQLPIGQDQTWQAPARSLNVPYTNNTGRAIEVSVVMTSTVAFLPVVDITQNGNTVTKTGTYATSGVNYVAVSAIIPNGASYRVRPSSGTGTVYEWRELRS